MVDPRTVWVLDRHDYRADKTPESVRAPAGSVVFLTPAKCASTTVLKALLAHQGRELPDGVAIHDRLAFQRMRRSAIARGDYRTVGVCRDPIRRSLSYWNRGQCKHADSWSRFVEWVVSSQDTESTNVHIRSQTFDLCCQGRLPDILLRVEHLKPDWQALEADFGWPRRPLGYFKTSRSRGAIVTPAQRAALQERYAEDYRWLPYERTP